ncbi:deSI-like protein At4g17486 isoform X2 [Nicotiana tomentosiformis]|uniref:deSI-like protein At4g17486 isoform X2 n=1 Tax=Nicotiana tomentosiformis TaxID=4098 RepID=UPI00388C846F
MKSKLKNGLCSVVPLHLQGESATRFCMFPKVKSACCSPGNTPVYLNVYDLTPVNGYFYWAGIGVFHTGVEVHGVEYAFGAHDYPTSGVFELEPRQCPGFKFRKSVFMGTTYLDPIQLREFIERQSVNYNGDSYHLIAKNCNHFSDDICYRLTGKRMPKWVNRLARVHYATAFFQKPSKLPRYDMIQMCKTMTVRRGNLEALSTVCHQSQCVKVREKYQCHRCSCTLTIKAAFHLGNPKNLEAGL